MSGGKKSRIDWERVERDYLHSNMSLRALAKTRGIGYSTVQRRAKEGAWAERRERLQMEDNAIRLEQVTDKLLRKIADTIDREENMDCKDYKALTSALKELKDVQERLGRDEKGVETLIIQMSAELEKMSG